MKIILPILFISFIAIPQFVFAAPNNFGELIDLFIHIINITIPILIALAVLGFFWGVFRYGFSRESEDKIKEGRKIMVWGFIALFVMVSIWGILRVLAVTFLY